ncbi:MAG: ECF transporter S component [Eubacterium sp.]|nr:ECF transporter S component [Eubacterium sp.]
MNDKLRKTVFCGVITAMIFVLTMFVKIPIGAGYIHFADSLMYACTALTGVWGLIAGAFGEALADAVGGYAVYIPFTIVIKILIALPFAVFSVKCEKILTVKNILFTLLGAVITVVGYIIADTVVAGKGFALTYAWMNIVQGLASSVFFILIAAAFDKMNIRKKFF